jgi:hypothetical protein
LESICCFKYDTIAKIDLANILVNRVKKSDQPLKVQWKAIKDWIEKIPVYHYDYSETIGNDCWTEHDDCRKAAPSFPPYPFES